MELVLRSILSHFLTSPKTSINQARQFHIDCIGMSEHDVPPKSTVSKHFREVKKLLSPGPGGKDKALAYVAGVKKYGDTGVHQMRLCDVTRRVRVTREGEEGGGGDGAAHGEAAGSAGGGAAQG